METSHIVLHDLCQHFNLTLMTIESRKAEILGEMYYDSVGAYLVIGNVTDMLKLGYSVQNLESVRLESNRRSTIRLFILSGEGHEGDQGIFGPT